MHHKRGFTMIELLVTIAIVTIMLVLAAPSFTRLVQSNTMSSHVNTYLSDIRFARSEAVRLGGRVILCRSDAPEADLPVCNTNAGPGGKGWISGWIIFHDRDANDDRSDGDEVLRVQAATSSIDTVLEKVTTVSTKLRFTATGRLMDPVAIRLHFGGPNFDLAVQRVVCINAGGRARIAGDGTVASTVCDP